MRSLVVIPTYKERANLARVVPAVLEVAPVGVLVVGDASPDGTGDLGDGLGRESGRRLSVLHRPGKAGLGAAYLAGFPWGLARRCDALLETGCEFAHDPGRIPSFLQAVARADVVPGSRYVAGGPTPDWPWSRRVLSRGGSVYAGRVLSLPYRDLTGGFKCFRRQALERIALEDVRASGYGFQIELSWRCHRAGLRIAEIPTAFPRSRGGLFKDVGADRVGGDVAGVETSARRPPLHRHRAHGSGGLNRRTELARWPSPPRLTNGAARSRTR